MFFLGLILLILLIGVIYRMSFADATPTDRTHGPTAPVVATTTTTPSTTTIARYINVDIINASTVLTDAQVSEVVPALQTQVTRDFAPVWGIDATLTFVAKGGTPDPSHWQLAVLDNSDQAGALGYHDITSTGMPLGKVFAGTDIQYGYDWHVTVSHELLEMLGDPDINLCAFDNQGRLFSYEMCDACEADNLGYMIGNIRVSDFLYPAYFETFQPNTAQFDYTKNIHAPFSLAPGGYSSIYVYPGGWTQINAELAHGEQRPVRAPVGSRRERRKSGRATWLASTI